MKAGNGSGRHEAAAATLRRTSRELRKVMAMVEDLEDVVGHAISRAGQADDRSDAGTAEARPYPAEDHGRRRFSRCAGERDAAGNGGSTPIAASRSVLLADLGAKLGAEAASRAPAVPLADAYEVF